MQPPELCCCLGQQGLLSPYQGSLPRGMGNPTDPSSRIPEPWKLLNNCDPLPRLKWEGGYNYFKFPSLRAQGQRFSGRGVVISQFGKKNSALQGLVNLIIRGLIQIENCLTCCSQCQEELFCTTPSTTTHSLEPQSYYRNQPPEGSTGSASILFPEQVRLGPKLPRQEHNVPFLLHAVASVACLHECFKQRQLLMQQLLFLKLSDSSIFPQALVKLHFPKTNSSCTAIVPPLFRSGKETVKSHLSILHTVLLRELS